MNELSPTKPVGRKQQDSVDPSEIWLITPAYNEAYVIGDLIDEVQGHGFQLVVVDDGSSDNTSAIVLEKGWVHLITHPFNLGQGASLRTGMDYAIHCNAKYLVHFDGDGQHQVDQVWKLVQPLADKSIEIVLGTRFNSNNGHAATIPRGKRLLLYAATIYTRLTTGLNITDTHNGTRAMTVEAAKKLSITQNRMSHASEILSLVSKLRMRYLEVPVTIIYSDYSKKKGQTSWNAFNILWDNFFGRFRK